MKGLLIVVLVVLIGVTGSEARADEHLSEQLTDEQIERFLGLRGYATYGQGTVSCGKWLEGRSQVAGKTTFDLSALSAVEGTAILNHVMRMSWLHGYISGFNRWGPLPQQPDKVRDIAVGTDYAGYAAWIDNWCRDNPLENLADAAGQLIWHLRERQGNEDF